MPIKQKGGEVSPYLQLQKALLTINILNFQKSDEQNRFQKHWGSLPMRPCLKVRWKDPLTNQWRGPDPLLTQGQGYGCVFPNRGETPIRLLAHNLKFLPSPQNNGKDQDEQ